MTKDTIVIADAMNYIKGYRYQLYCIVRAMGTTHCIVLFLLVLSLLINIL